MTILEDLYYGNIRPSEQCVINDSDYDRMRNDWQKLHKSFTENLSENDMKNFNELIDIQGHMSEIVAAENYMQGFRHGAEMILDVLFGESKNLKYHTK